MAKTAIFSLGGSIIVPDRIDESFIVAFRDLVLDFVSGENRAVIVCGGGRTCRDYVNSAIRITDGSISDTEKDWVGIMATRLNAELIRAVFAGHAYEKVIGNPEEKIRTDKKIIIGAGYLPGHSSDMDAVLLAINLSADRVINMSNIDYVYDKDPGKHQDAKPIRNISYDDFYKISGTEWIPSMNLPFDAIATKKAQENNIKIIVLNGKNLENLRRCIEGKDFDGTNIG